ncbi:MAG: hypothetical protein K2Q22_12785 [Cytophagales bacterium]|nr:hypothetical protein [Cytophagales bacterium]
MDQIKNYFGAERAESLLFVIVGFTAVLFGLYLLVWARKSFDQGLAIPLMVLAAVQIVVGGTVFFRSPKDLVRVERMVNSNSIEIQQKEIPRMEKVMKNFEIYRAIEISCILAGLVMMFAFKKNEFVNGLGIGLFIQSSLMLALDFFAERRGWEYLEYLKSLK